jgi:DnaK suppressor protein
MALVQMKSEMLARIEGAIRRLEAGTYGNCAECDQPIPTARLRALPFAIRCAPCEAARETSSTRRTAGMTRAYPHVGGVAD